jgi:AcrR family transcriptional regulator
MAVARLSPHPLAAETTRGRLLDAAERLFAAHGFRATSVRDITAAAGCNVAAVNYHFRNKESLYREMFRRRLRVLREQRIASIRRAMDSAGERASLEQVLEGFTTAFLEPHLDQSAGRRLMQLFSREMLDPHLRPGTLWREMIEPVQHALARAVRALAPGLGAAATRRCIHSLIAQLVHVVQVRNAPGAPPAVARADFAFPQVVAHIVRFSCAGIRAHAS